MMINRLFGDEIEFMKNIEQDSKVLEIGTLDGASASAFAEKASIVVTVDVFNGFRTEGDSRDEYIKDFCGEFSIQRTFDNLKDKKNVVMLVGMSRDVVPLLQDFYFDFIFIDASHGQIEVEEDIRTCFPKLKPNGKIMFHDYMCPAWPGVKKAVDNWFDPTKGTLVGGSRLLEWKDFKVLQ